MSTLERAVALAAEAHAGQVDKAGAPYILHPLRVMLRLAGTDERIAAVLHDMIEDCAWTPERLRLEGFSEAVVAAVEALSKRPGEEYESAIRRAAADPVARAVKLADLADNSDLSRIAQPTDQDRARVEKYRRAIALIRSLGAPDAGAARPGEVPAEDAPAPAQGTRMCSEHLKGLEGPECPIPGCSGPGRGRSTGWVEFSQWGWMLEFDCPEHGTWLASRGALRGLVSQVVRGSGQGGEVG